MLATLVPPPPLSPRRDGPGPRHSGALRRAASGRRASGSKRSWSRTAPEPGAPLGSAAQRASLGLQPAPPGRCREGPAPAAPGPALCGGREPLRALATGLYRHSSARQHGDLQPRSLGQIASSLQGSASRCARADSALLFPAMTWCTMATRTSCARRGPWAIT